MSITLPRSFPPTAEPRDRIARVCLSASEQARLRQLARAQGRSVSELLRVAAEPLLRADPGTRGDRPA